MYPSKNKLLLTLYFECIRILNIFGYEPDLREMVKYSSESAHWPLQAGYPGLHITNLNEYVSLFSHCLVNIQNYQGIEIIGIKSPVYLTRFDVAFLKVCDWGQYRFFFGKIPLQSNSKQNCTIDYSKVIEYTDKSFNARWYCTAQFDLFFPEPEDAPHIVYHSQMTTFSYYGIDPEATNLFDIDLEHIGALTLRYYREDWSKILK